MTGTSDMRMISPPLFSWGKIVLLIKYYNSEIILERAPS